VEALWQLLPHEHDHDPWSISAPLHLH
jgi:hypothetical protein